METKPNHIALVALTSLLVRSMVAQGPHSGLGVAPMHGDFEAQRHWMEITLHVPMNDWYVGRSEGNDLLYWGLDYPPLTAFHSLLCGKLFNSISPESVALGTSRGIESPITRTMMRLLVLGSDAITFVPAVISFIRPTTTADLPLVLLMLNAPGFVLIDHGHFQFNCVAHGLVVMSLAFLVGGGRVSGTRAVLASILFCLAICFKQMALYYSPLFFFHLLGWAASKREESWRQVIQRIFLLSVTVVATFVLVFLPFILNGTAVDVVRRMFPFERGIFEDKVANFWCSSNVVFKWKQYFSHPQLAILALGLTLLAIAPPSLKAFVDRTRKQTLLSAFAISLSFFLFSFQVHEKSILLPLVPAVLLLSVDSDSISLGFWFAVVSTLSMTPLFLKDGIGPTSGFFLALYIIFGVVTRQKDILRLTFLNGMSMVASICLGVTSVLVASATPPSKYPDLFVVVHNVVGFACFSFYLLLVNYLQWKDEIRGFIRWNHEKVE